MPVSDEEKKKVEEEAAKVGPSPKAETDQQKREKKSNGVKSKKFKIGCLSLVLFLVIFVIIMYFAEKPEIKVEGDFAKSEITFFIDSLDTAAYQLADLVYSTAKEHPNIKKITVDLKISKGLGGGLRDKYGNEVSADLEMGQIVISDLDEVRKYREQSIYTSNDENHKFYKDQISEKRYSYLLTDK